MVLPLAHVDDPSPAETNGSEEGRGTEGTGMNGFICSSACPRPWGNEYGLALFFDIKRLSEAAALDTREEERRAWNVDVGKSGL
jgi:hypothetical protein